MPLPSTGRPSPQEFELSAPSHPRVVTPEFGPISAVQSALSVSRSAAYSLVASGEIRSVKLGRSRRVDLRDLERFIAELRGEASTVSA